MFSLWGFEADDPALLLLRIAAAGYTGIEAPTFIDTRPYREAGLDYVAQGFCDSVDSVKRAIDQAVELGATLVNLQVGKDYWESTVADQFLSGCQKVCTQSPVPVVFETHRGRLFYSAASSSPLLTEHPWIRLCADFSHWTCVSESLLDDQHEAVERAIQHSDYVHARIGHSQGAQVCRPDHTSAESGAFLAWWHGIVAARQLGNTPVLRVDPEYGPAPYMICPGDLWQIRLATVQWLTEKLSSG